MGSDLKFYRGTGETSSLGPGEVNGPVIARHEPCGVSAVAQTKRPWLRSSGRPPSSLATSHRRSPLHTADYRTCTGPV